MSFTTMHNDYLESGNPMLEDDPPCESCKWDGGSNCVLTVGCRYEPKDEPKASATQVGGTHYVNKVVQPWDAMQAWMTPEQFAGFLLGSAIAYLGRFNTEGVEGKGGITDIRKARHYLDKLIETQASGTST